MSINILYAIRGGAFDDHPQYVHCAVRYDRDARYALYGVGFRVVAREQKDIYRVVRGGSWYLVAEFCCSSSRYWIVPGYRYHGLGFRLCCTFNKTLAENLGD